MKKISNREVKEQILAAIGKEIDKRGEFQTAGIAFFGYDFDFKLNITLVSRGEREMEITGTLGQVTLEPTLPTDEITKITIPSSGKGGKKTKKAREVANV